MIRRSAIERDRRQSEGAGEALRQHHLEDVARDNIVLGAIDHLGIAARFQHRRHVDLGNVGRGGHGRQRRGQAGGGRVDPPQRLRDRLFRVGGLILPYRGDQEQGVGQAIEHQDDGRPHEQHVRQGDVVGGGAGQLFDQAHSLIAEIADQTGERGRQGGVQIGAAFGDQRAQRLQRILFGRDEGVAIGRPLAVDLALGALGAIDEVGGQADQAVAATHRAALDRFQQEVAAVRLEQLERSGDRRVCVGNLPPPHQTRTALCQCRASDGRAVHHSPLRRHLTARRYWWRTAPSGLRPRRSPCGSRPCPSRSRARTGRHIPRPRRRPAGCGPGSAIRAGRRRHHA